MKDEVLQYEDNLNYVKTHLPDLMSVVHFKELGEGQMKGFVVDIKEKVKVESELTLQQRSMISTEL